MKSIQILCPDFREEDVILDFHDRLLRAVEPLRGAYRLSFVYVVDPGGDRTERILLDLASRCDEVRVLVMSRRFGHQAALMAGIDACAVGERGADRADDPARRWRNQVHEAGDFRAVLSAHLQDRIHRPKGGRGGLQAA
jgi:glycosyltransferase involved in cell wall biosynthesis